MTVSISPVFNGFQFFDNNGAPLAGGKLFQYEAGSSSVEQATYADSDGATENSNPIVLDSSGRMPTDIWLTDGLAYHLVLTQSDGTTVLETVDNVIGVVSSSTTGTESNPIWTLVEDVPTYVGPTQFLVPGNLTTQFYPGNRVQVRYAGPTYAYATVASRTFSSPNTQVTLVNDSGTLGAGLEAVYWSQAVVNGMVVDAGAVSYRVPSQYTSTTTVGGRIVDLEEEDVAINTRVSTTYAVWTSSGTGTYTISVTDTDLTSYTTGMNFTVKFANASTGAATLNVNSWGAKNLKVYSSAGSKVDPTITASMVSDVAYDGTDFILLDPLPAAPASAPPHGQQVFASNGTFTVPSDVYYVKVTVVGGGGGGGGGSTFSSGETTSEATGGSGGNGGVGVKYLSVTPAATYSVTIGSGGSGGAGSYFGSGSNGTNGGSTTFGASLVVATGGGAGGGATTSNGSNGSNGYGSVADYGVSVGGWQIGSGMRGTSGVGGSGYANGAAGTAGMCVVEW